MVFEAMRGLDTNVLVRYQTEDDPKQLRVAERFLADCREKEEPLFLPALVVCELVWVLSRPYGFSKNSIVNTLERILDAAQFRIEHDVLVRHSLESFRHGPADFSDYLIGEISRQAGCRDTVSFDQALKGAPGFTVLS